MHSYVAGSSYGIRERSIRSPRLLAISSTHRFTAESLLAGESEALEALRRDYEVDLDPAQARRNLLTRGVPLNHLVGREFRVGGVTLRGLRLCEP